MSLFNKLMNDTVSILKKDGQIHEGIKAAVSSAVITIDRSDLLIEPRDLIQRHMSNGGKETYEVIDPGFNEEFHGIPAHYQVKAKKLGLPEAERAVQSITVNVSGANARINTNSLDYSTNVYANDSGVVEHLQALRAEVERCGKSEDLDIVAAIEGQFESGKPSRTVVRTLLDGLPVTASISSIGSFLLNLLG